jgi:uncharacterized membrane protein
MASMTLRFISALAFIVTVAACDAGPGAISRDTKPFDGIAAGAAITLVGTEPFWGIDIVDGPELYSATYTTPENLGGTSFKLTRFAGNNGLGFSGEMDASPVQIALTPGKCSDGMSDRTFPYTATFALGDITLYGCGYTSDEPFTGAEAP